MHFDFTIDPFWLGYFTGGTLMWAICLGYIRRPPNN